MIKRKTNKNKLKKGITTFLILGATVLNAQVAASLQEQESEIRQIGQIIVNIILGVFGAISLLNAILIFIGSGSGEEKIKKSGTYIFMLVFVAVSYFLSTKLFNQ